MMAGLRARAQEEIRVRKGIKAYAKRTADPTSGLRLPLDDKGERGGMRQIYELRSAAAWVSEGECHLALLSCICLRNTLALPICSGPNKR